MNRLFFVLATCLLMFIGGCSTTDGEHGPSVANKPLVLAGSQWVLNSWSAVEMAPGPPLTLGFTDTRVFGSGGCNRLFGNYDAASQAIGSLASTRMACPHPLMGQEQRYMEALGAVTRIALTQQGQLRIEYRINGSDDVMLFNKIAESAAN